MALDKESKTAGKKQYHIHLKPGDIGNYVLLPGDPARSDRVAQYLENAELVANNREHRTFTGYYKGVKAVSYTHLPPTKREAPPPPAGNARPCSPLAPAWGSGPHV